MGVSVSNWRLARTVSMLGQLGVVSGTAMDTVMVRRLQDGDPGGLVRRALAAFPFQQWVEPVLNRYFRPEGRQGAPYKRIPLPSRLGDTASQILHVLGGYVEVFLAKEGHSGLVGINLLTKLQIPTLGTLYGAMLAGVDYVLMGAGIPREIPEALDKLAAGKTASLKLDVTGWTSSEAPRLQFNPLEIAGQAQTLKRPNFLPIIASNSLATLLARKVTGTIQGFVIEGPTAGGHNAPPRGAPVFDERGQPVYGERDVVDLEQIKALGLPFWLAGGTGSPEALEQALDQGAAGIQVGTLFAYSQESGFEAGLKERVLEQAARGEVRVFTDPKASPTGFPFKVAEIEGTLSQPEVYRRRTRVCDLGYLREAYQTPEGKIGFRCASEPVDQYLAKGGDPANTEGRKCLCNALLAAVGQGQVQKNGDLELPLVTSGDDLERIGRFVRHFGKRYSARDVVAYLLGKRPISEANTQPLAAGG
ncbi:MAG: nitronate monooxygenase [Meiothermus sp.]|uniref:nitronate monooxygenase n=1 Tax=Meiothermus sp. TaxID=1955249 RepID=UPI0025D89590|nr:nitronate monooxygenase [Meiothermus sp.]MCS7067025.1 nitronate monooxygenase [Meiothermus sp.]MCX7600717.1 nitronate monooxygenase [Meiothermus sp.]MDW8425400.1 nitronate monooxygenase [Meiothermus sp.]